MLIKNRDPNNKKVDSDITQVENNADLDMEATLEEKPIKFSEEKVFNDFEFK